MHEIGKAGWIGTTARDLLTRRNFSGRVLAVVTGAVYLQLETRFLQENGFLVWLSQKHLPMHARAIRGDFDFGALQIGMTFESDGTNLRFDNNATVQFANARLWQPQRIDPGRVVPREVVTARVRELADLTGLSRPVRSLRELIGLGEGLTPSGDDFVGGQLFAQWHLHQAYPGLMRWNQTAIDDLVEYARTRTNAISHAILRDHAKGQSIEPLHNLIVALLRGESFNEIMPHVEKLLAIGNTSGREMLAGSVGGMLSLGTISSL